MTGSTSGTVAPKTPTSAIEVYADIWCPFAYVGIHSVLERRDELGRDDVLLMVRAWPLELLNGVPLDPSTTARHVDELRSQVAPHLFKYFDPLRFPTTSLPALALVAGAYRQDVRLGETVSIALRDALFEEGRDISDPDVLAEIAATHVICVNDDDRESVLREWHEGQARGVRGSPHFFCRAAEVYCPSLDIAKNVDGSLWIERTRGALDGFLDKCLASSTSRS